MHPKQSTLRALPNPHRCLAAQFYNLFRQPCGLGFQVRAFLVQRLRALFRQLVQYAGLPFADLAEFVVRTFAQLAEVASDRPETRL